MIERNAVNGVDALHAGRNKSNKKLMATLQEDEHSKELHELTCKDAELQRMSPPVAISSTDRVDCLLAPRFARVQEKHDGT